MQRSAIKGAVLGLVVGLLALGAAFVLALRCLPYRIALPAPPWPWVCTDPAYGILAYLAFPVNILTNDLSRTVLYAPLSLLMYILLGALIGWAIAASRGRQKRQPA